MADVSLGYRPDGKRDRRTVYGRTKEEVAAKLADLRVKAARGELPAPNRTTLGAYLREWLGTHRNSGGRDGQGLRPNTYRAYEGVIRLHIAPVLGEKPVQKVTPGDLERLYRAMLNKGLGTRMAEMAHVVLHTAFEAAVKKGLLARNPCDQLPNPPRTQYRAEDRPRLAWEDVPRVLAEAANRKLVLAPLKTRSSLRDVPLPADVAAALRKHRAAQKVVNLEGYVFTSRSGGPIRPEELDHAWARIRRRLGLHEDLHLHDLRGSYITWLAERGVNPKAAAKILGHADVKTTHALYQTVTKTMYDEAARASDGITRTASDG